MMLEVEVGGWEHECCGQQILIDDVVSWQVFVDSHGTLHETHHDVHEPQRSVSGRVAALWLVRADGERVAIESIPGAPALRALAEDDTLVLPSVTGDPLSVGTTDRFLVTLA